MTSYAALKRTKALLGQGTARHGQLLQLCISIESKLHVRQDQMVWSALIKRLKLYWPEPLLQGQKRRRPLQGAMSHIQQTVLTMIPGASPQRSTGSSMHLQHRDLPVFSVDH